MSWQLFSLCLSHAQLQGLSKHKYSSEGVSITEPVMQVYWRWLVTKTPLWVAPNLITGIGLLINIATILPLLLLDTNLEGVAPSWTYLSAAIGLFIYQSLDAIDGKQARRTGSANQLGELFDHGCDAISLLLVLTSGASAIGLHDNPITLISYVVLLGQINYVYHWQTYVCGTLHFNLFDVTEGEFSIITLLLIRGVWGLRFWDYQVPVLNYGLKMVMVYVLLAFSVVDMLLALRVIYTKGVGRAKALLPLVTMLVQVPVPFLYISISYSTLTNHCLLLVTAMTLPTAKAIIIMLISTLTKSTYPLFDIIYIAPWIALLNVYCGSPLPQFICLVAIVVWEIVDLCIVCVSVCLQVSHFLNVPIFSLPQTSTTTTNLR